jgi:hypothetical protein
VNAVFTQMGFGKKELSKMYTPRSDLNQPQATLPVGQPLACDLTAINAAERPIHAARAERLLSTAFQERQALADGYALRYTADEYAELVAFIANERLCCPFFRFTLEVSPAQGPIWLRITGGEGAKELFRSLFAASHQA